MEEDNLSFWFTSILRKRNCSQGACGTTSEKSSTPDLYDEILNSVVML